MKTILIVAVLAFVLGLVRADIYLQSPLGSNDRHEEANRDRNNANRIFDSQNNNRGGYNRGTAGNVYYYEGSTLNFEWTNQHSCGTDGTNPTNNNCEVIIQYMCDSKIRDGTTGNTITDTAAADADPQYGRHESFDSYALCKATERNKGLYTANQNLAGNDARYTRQNPNGARSGLECPEERDYYPYWRPTPWVDLAILTNQPARCSAYVAASQNNGANSLGLCAVPQTEITTKLGQGQTGFVPNNKAACEAAGYTWTVVKGKSLPDPKCMQTGFSRDNHLGNGLNSFGFPLGVNITIPSLQTGVARDNCIFRMRYNISTNDAEGTLGAKQAAESTLFTSKTAVGAGVLNATANSGKKNPNANNDPAEVAIWSKYGLTRAQVAASFATGNNNPVESREYVFKNNPKVAPFADAKTETTSTSAFTLPRQADGTMLKFQLAINTNQFGRTFQDRTHTLAIKPRPAEIPLDAPIQNLQVSGKRGNIVQVYPGTEYKFSPDQVTIKENDYVHFQWQGSNTNPQNNAGQGTAGTDRSNVVRLQQPKYYEGQPVPPAAKFPTYGQLGASYPATIQEDFLGLSLEAKLGLATLVKPGTTGGNNPELNDSPAYYDNGPKQVSGLGNYNYMSTRNNNFSNRGQKGTITVANYATAAAAIGQNGGTVEGSGGSGVYVRPGALVALSTLTVDNIRPGSSNTFGNSASDFLRIEPYVIALTEGAAISVSIPYTTSPLSKAHVYTATDLNAEYTEVPNAMFSNGKATFDTQRGGVYVVQTKTNTGAIAGIVIAVVFVLALAAGFCVKRYRDKMAFENAKRSQNNPLQTQLTSV